MHFGKLKSVLAVAALVGAVAVQAGESQRECPGFGVQTQEQLDAWRANLEAKTPSAPVFSSPQTTGHQPQTIFYTGKPYDADQGAYLFKYRAYDPNAARWTTSDPSGFPDGANAWVYVNNSVTRAFDPWGLAVYWAARDLASYWTPIGNHHFLLIVPDNAQDFAGQTSDLGNGNMGFTRGGFKGNNGMLVSQSNNVADVHAAYEHYTGDTGWEPDYDLEIHQVTAPNGMSDTAFINAIQTEINRYNQQCPYSTGGPNCSSWVNTMLERVGVPLNDRLRLGEFSGVDWGEEELIPKTYFE